MILRSQLRECTSKKIDQKSEIDDNRYIHMSFSGCTNDQRIIKCEIKI